MVRFLAVLVLSAAILLSGERDWLPDGALRAAASVRAAGLRASEMALGICRPLIPVSRQTARCPCA
jgi:hypothetical protein